MATQGIVSVLRNGQVVLKVIAGCDGYNANELAAHIKQSDSLDLEHIYRLAMAVGFGSEESLVVMNAERVYYPYDDDTVPSLYRKTFSNPRFNPRWQHGTVDADCLAIIEM